MLFTSTQVPQRRPSLSDRILCYYTHLISTLGCAQTDFPLLPRRPVDFLSMEGDSEDGPMHTVHNNIYQ